ncbi:MAG TPA: inositol monophosphatase family protein [Acetobacteraceae bacterium]|nr:inositol monophosphatase family protein [Acetobacteraceae bacterium]
MPLDPKALLPAVIAAAEQAGEAVAREFVRPGGPRFTDHVTAPVDHEVELFLRGRLLDLLPARFVGEEAGVVGGPANGFCWVVDPHDGTRAFLEGRRGSAVSIALLRGGQPVLAVVFAPLSPDRGPDLIAWAEGGPLTRNGVPVTGDLRRRGLNDGEVVFLNHGAWQRPVWSGTRVAPGRFMPLPSIAYRLARVAAGDGVGTVTLRPVAALDIAAGHALVRAAGGVLLAEDGTPVTYNEQGESRPSACFGGAPEAVRSLLARTWRGSTEPRRDARVTLHWPRAADEAALDRAIGCLLGLLIADSQGSALAGQPGSGGEAALALARTLVGRTQYDADAAAEAHARWSRSGPAGSPAEAVLMRAVPIGIWAGDPTLAAAAAAQDAALTEPALAGACAAIAAAIASGQAPDVPVPPAVAAALRGAAQGRAAWTPAQALAVLTCRPDSGLGVANPRPEEYWPDDLADLAEGLLLTRTRAG